MSIEKITKEFENLDNIKIFEIEVINKKTNEKDYIIFHIFIKDNEFIAQHESLNFEQEKSDKISFVSSEIDVDFSLESNLQNLYESCIYAIIDSEFFDLPND